MGNFQGGGYKGGNKEYRGGGGGGFKKSFGGDRGGNRDNRGGGDRGEVVMHRATCSECNKTCEVPFRPTGEKPVYCRDCFASKREDGFSSESRGGRDSRSDRGGRSDRNDRPAPRTDFTKSAGDGEMKKQLADISTKLDRLISAMEKMSQSISPSLNAIVKKAVASPTGGKKAPAKKAVAKKVVPPAGGKKKK